MRRSIVTIARAAFIAAIGSAGTVCAEDFYVSFSDFSNNSIHKVSSSGSDLGVFASQGLNDPQGIAFDSQGNLYVASELNNTVRKFDRSGADLGVFAGGLSFPISVAFDSQHNLYVTNGRQGTIQKFGPTGTNLGIFASIDTVGLTGIAFDRNGNLYVANQIDDTIHEFGPTGADLGTFADTGLAAPYGLAFDSSGNLYVANSEVGGRFGNPLGSSIHKFSPTGVDLGVFASSALLRPHGLAFDNSGDLYVADYEGHRIRIFGPSGADLANISINGFPNFIAFAPVPEPSCTILALVGAVALTAFVRQANQHTPRPRSAARSGRTCLESNSRANVQGA